MSTEFEELQELILADARNIYSETVIDHAMNPRNVGVMQDADGFARVTGPCGDTMEIWLKVNNDAIAGATFMTDGCGTSIASGSMVTEMAKGNSISEAQKTTQREVLDGAPLSPWYLSPLDKHRDVCVSIVTSAAGSG